MDNRLSIPVGENSDPALLYMPKPGTGIINTEDDIFTKREIYASGVFPGNDQLNNYIIGPLELGQELLNLPKNSAYKIVIKLKRGEHIGAWKAGVLCVPNGDLNWKGGKLNIDSDEFTETFKEELEKYNFKKYKSN